MLRMPGSSIIMDAMAKLNGLAKNLINSNYNCKVVSHNDAQAQNNLGAVYTREKA